MWYNDNIINILLIGRDLGKGSKYYPRADSVIIVSINKLKNDIKLVSLSRATYVSIPGHGNADSTRRTPTAERSCSLTL